MTLEEFLYDLIAFKLIICDTQDFKGLLSCDKPALYPKTFLSNLLPALVAELLHRRFIGFFVQVLKYLLHAVTFG